MFNEKIYIKNPNRPALIKKGHRQKKGICSYEHFHTEIEFVYVQEGTMLYCTNDTQEIAQSGSIIFINSKVPHSTEYLCDGTRSALVQFRVPSFMQSSIKYLPVFFKNQNVSSYVFSKEDEDFEELKNVIENMLRYDDIEDISHDFYITSSIYAIIALLHRKKFLPEIENSVDMELIKKIYPVFEYIDENYNQVLTVEELAKVLNISKEYFCRLFKKIMGVTSTEYVNYVRVCKAEKMLKTNMTLSEIAYAVGMTSLSYFNVIFKKHKQCSPSEYRKMYRQPDGLLN